MTRPLDICGESWYTPHMSQSIKPIQYWTDADNMDWCTAIRIDRDLDNDAAIIEDLERDARCTDDDAVCSKVFYFRDDYCNFCAGRD